MDFVQMMIRARYVTHQQLEQRGYWLIDRKKEKQYRSLEVCLETFSSLSIEDISELTEYYINRQQKKVWIYCTFCVFNMHHITYLLSLLHQEPMDMQILSCVPPKPADIPYLRTFNPGHRVDIVQISEHIADVGQHFFVNQYELVPVDDEEEVLSDLMVKKSALPRIRSSDVQLKIKGLHNLEGRILRVLGTQTIKYSLVIPDQMEKKE